MQREARECGMLTRSRGLRHVALIALSFVFERAAALWSQQLASSHRGRQSPYSRLRMSYEDQEPVRAWVDASCT